MNASVATLLAMAALTVLMLVRNKWVHDMRISILYDSRWNSTKNSHVEYERLPGQFSMLWQLYKWDYEEVFDDGLWNDIEITDMVYKKDAYGNLELLTDGFIHSDATDPLEGIGEAVHSGIERV